MVLVLLIGVVGCASVGPVTGVKPSPSTPPAVSPPALTPPTPAPPPPATPPTVSPPSPPVAPPPVTWAFCAKEYTGCSFTGLRDVRYVLDGTATVKAMYGGLESCDSGHFGLANGGSGTAVCEVASRYKTVSVQNPMPGMSGLGASVNLPLGDPGYADARIADTEDRGNPSDIGAFRVPCAPTHFGFDDPIVSPGKPGASHLHMFFGNTGTDAYSTVDSINDSGNSSCGGGILDRTAYWVPAMIDGQGNVVLPESAIFYYKTGYLGIKPQDVKALPSGLRIIAGDKNLSSAQGQGHWGCNEVYIGHKDAIRDVVDDPRCGPGKHVTLGVDFPQCWDGQNLDAADHHSHMANPVNGACPADHPVPLPVITFNVNFRIPPDGAHDWHLSSDMYDYKALGGGYSAHADWWNGWEPTIEQTWIENCNNASKDCHAYLLGDGRTLR
jgi:Domain of unknown function (DUF1996)